MKTTNGILFFAMLLTGACSTASKTAAPTVEASTSAVHPLFEQSWQLEQKDIDQKIANSNVHLKVDYDTYLVFSEGKVKQDVICKFREPISKTLIVTTEAPAIYVDNKVKILKDSFEKQEYKQKLVPKSGKGPNKQRSLFCHSELKAKEYLYSTVGDELILKPVEEILKLKKYIR